MSQKKVKKGIAKLFARRGFSFKALFKKKKIFR